MVTVTDDTGWTVVVTTGWQEAQKVAPGNRETLDVKRRIAERSSSETFHVLRFTFHERQGRPF